MAADSATRSGPAERDVEQAVIALKKGAYLLKYGRRGKPKFCPFRLSNDELSLIWYSGNEEKQLRLSCVSRIVPGQRTAIFRRYPRPEKEYQSFSLICDDRSLDLICKDKEEAEVWFTGLRALISGSPSRKLKLDSKIDGSAFSDANSPVGHAYKNSPLSSPYDSSESLNQVENLTRRCQLQEVELKHSASQLQEAIKIAGEEAAKCKAAKDVIKSLTAQLKGMTERLSGDFHPYDNSETTPLNQMRMPTIPQPVLASCGLSSTNINGFSRNAPGGSANGGAAASIEDGAVSHLHGGRLALNQVSSRERPSHFRSTMNYTSTENGHAPGVEWVEHDEQGVYITLTSLPGGGRDLKRVRFSRKRFSEKQAELWWQENKARVHEQYNIRVIGKSVMGASVSPRLGEEEGNSSSSNSLRDV